MAKNQNKRLATSTLAEDETAFNALQNVTGYTPANPAYAVTAVTQAVNDMRLLKPPKIRRRRSCYCSQSRCRKRMDGSQSYARR